MQPPACSSSPCAEGETRTGLCGNHFVILVPAPCRAHSSCTRVVLSQGMGERPRGRMRELSRPRVPQVCRRGVHLGRHGGKEAWGWTGGPSSCSSSPAPRPQAVTVLPLGSRRPSCGFVSACSCPQAQWVLPTSCPSCPLSLPLCLPSANPWSTCQCQAPNPMQLPGSPRSKPVAAACMEGLT